MMRFRFASQAGVLLLASVSLAAPAPTLLPSTATEHTADTAWPGDTVTVAQNAQPVIQEPEVPEVQPPSQAVITEPQIPAVDVPRVTGGDGAVLGSSSCDCPETNCRNDSLPGCSVQCPASNEGAAVCACDGYCTEDGDPTGNNLCRCQ